MTTTAVRKIPTAITADNSELYHRAEHAILILFRRENHPRSDDHDRRLLDCSAEMTPADWQTLELIALKVFLALTRDGLESMQRASFALFNQLTQLIDCRAGCCVTMRILLQKALMALHGPDEFMMIKGHHVTRWTAPHDGVLVEEWQSNQYQPRASWFCTDMQVAMSLVESRHSVLYTRTENYRPPMEENGVLLYDVGRERELPVTVTAAVQCVDKGQGVPFWKPPWVVEKEKLIKGEKPIDGEPIISAEIGA
jgi:hypothetical protein